MHTLWNNAADETILPFSEVHVWSACVAENSSLSEWQGVLAKEESERAATFRDAQAQMQFVTSRVALREILGRYLGIARHKIKFTRGPHGKLALGTRLENEIQFNLSHSRDLILLAFTRQRQVGIDVERIELFPEVITIAQNFFFADEAEQLKAAPRPDEVFFRHWTRKEAVLKCSGRGFDDTMSALDCFGGTISDLQPATGYAAALAVTGQKFSLKTWHWVSPAKEKGFSAIAAAELAKASVSQRKGSSAAEYVSV